MGMLLTQALKAKRDEKKVDITIEKKIIKLNTKFEKGLVNLNGLLEKAKLEKKDSDIKKFTEIIEKLTVKHNIEISELESKKEGK